MPKVIVQSTQDCPSKQEVMRAALRAAVPIFDLYAVQLARENRMKRFAEVASVRDQCLNAVSSASVPLSSEQHSERTSLDRLNGGDAWRTIDSAPLDGTWILVWLGAPWSQTEKARWYAPWGNWHVGEIPYDPAREDCSGIGTAIPTHWMPLPIAPECTC